MEVQKPNPALASPGFLTLPPQPDEPDSSSPPGIALPFQALVPEPRAAQKVKAQVQLWAEWAHHVGRRDTGMSRARVRKADRGERRGLGKRVKSEQHS